MHILDFCYIYGILPFSNAGYRIFLSVLGFSNFVFWVLVFQVTVLWHSGFKYSSVSAVSLN